MFLNCDLFSALFMISARILLSSGLWAAAIACRDTAADPPNNIKTTKTGLRLRFVFLTAKPSWLVAGEPVWTWLGCNSGLLVSASCLKFFMGCNLGRDSL